MSVIDDYLAKVTPPEREALERVRHIVRAALPVAEEAISYGMPAFRYQGKYLIAFAPFKDHLSVFPASHAIEVVKNRLNGFTTTKGSIHFTLDKPLPESLIRKLVQVRKSDIDG